MVGLQGSEMLPELVSAAARASSAPGSSSGLPSESAGAERDPLRCGLLKSENIPLCRMSEEENWLLGVLDAYP